VQFGFPLLLGVVLRKIDREKLQIDPDLLQSFGWSYSAYEADVFYYGWMALFR
jgi:hypothetical protein